MAVITYPCHNLNQSFLVKWDVGIQHRSTNVNHTPDSKVHGTNMGPISGRQDPGGPHVGPMNFDIWDANEMDFTPSQTGKELGPTSIKYPSEAKMSDKCLVNVNLRVFDIWDWLTLSSTRFSPEDS